MLYIAQSVFIAITGIGVSIFAQVLMTLLIGLIFITNAFLLMKREESE